MSEESQPIDRDLTTTRTQVFGDVEKGTQCRICGRNVTDGRRKTCSGYCGNILDAVMGMLNWSSLRRQVTDRDDETCQECGWDRSLESRARDHIRDRIDDLAGERPESPPASKIAEREDFDWDDYHERRKEWREHRDELKDRYGDPYKHARSLEVDHIEPIVEGGHPFDPGNLQTLCTECHRDKTAAENSERAQTPSRGELSESLFDYVSGESGGVEQ